MISLLNFIPTAFIPALSLLIFGYFNSKRYKFYLLLAGIFLLAYYMFSIINYALVILNPLAFFENIILYMFLRYFSFAISLAAYLLLIVQGILNKQSLFRNTGIIMSAVLVFVFFFYSFLSQLIFEFF